MAAAPHIQRYRDYVPPRGTLGLLAPTHGNPGSGAGGGSIEDVFIGPSAGFTTPPMPIRRYNRKDWANKPRRPFRTAT